MRILVFLVVVATATAADLQAVETQSSGRSVQSSKTTNTISLPQKPDQYYQEQIQQQPAQLQHLQLQQTQQPYPLQYVSQPIYQQQQPQPAMIIITQPPPIPSQSMLSHAAQHLLNYFHANPQARYQFLQGNYQTQPQPQQAYVTQGQNSVPAYTYQIMTVQPQYQQLQGHQSQSSAPFVPSPQVPPLHHHQVLQQASQHTQQSSSPQSESQYTPQIQIPIIGPFGHGTHIPHIATLAQLATQKYIPSNPYRATTPALITGLENFTPEQQAQIKAQLQSGGPITPLRANLPPNFGASLQQNSSALKSTAAPTQSTSPQEFPEEDEDKNSAQQGTQQISTSSSYNSGIGYGNQFTKG